MVASPLMSERENIFARIREALRVAAPVPGHHGEPHKPVVLPGAMDHRRVLPPVGKSLDEQMVLFAKNAAELRATFRLLNNPPEVDGELRALRDTEGWKRVASHKG